MTTLPPPYYQDEAVTLYHGDCREIVPLLGRFDLLLTDPPYGTEGLGGGYGRRQLHTVDGRMGRTILGDVDLSVATEGLYLSRQHIDHGWAVVFCAPRKIQEAVMIVPDAEFFGELIWNKSCPGLGYTIRYLHESALVFKIGNGEKPTVPLLSLITDAVNHADSASKHPHTKPLSFWRNALRLPGLNILDPFAGSGTTGRAAKDLGRKCTMIEREERYCEIAAKRMCQEVLAL